jgi:hypothetical protein
MKRGDSSKLFLIYTETSTRSTEKKRHTSPKTVKLFGLPVLPRLAIKSPRPRWSAKNSYKIRGLRDPRARKYTARTSVLPAERKTLDHAEQKNNNGGSHPEDFYGWHEAYSKSGSSHCEGEMRKVFFLPSLSPAHPIIRAPNGRTTRPMAKVERRTMRSPKGYQFERIWRRGWSQGNH